jgi:hypothetical protein
LWPKFAGIRFLVLTSLDGKDRGKTSEHCIIAPSAGDIGTHGPARQLRAAEHSPKKRHFARTKLHPQNVRPK